MTISCEKAALICNKFQYNEATWWDKFRLKRHLKRCKSCAEYTEKNTAFTSLCEKAALNCLSESEKDKMKEMFKDFS